MVAFDKVPKGNPADGCPPIIFDEDYSGPRWTYALVNRPLDVACQPRGLIALSAHKHPKYPHGTIDYPRQLTDREVNDHELVLVGTYRPEPTLGHDEYDLEIHRPGYHLTVHAARTCAETAPGDEPTADVGFTTAACSISLVELSAEDLHRLADFLASYASRLETF